MKNHLLFIAITWLVYFNPTITHATVADLNTISGTITVEGDFVHNNFGVSVFAADNPDPLNSSPLASGPVNPDGTYLVDLIDVPADIIEFKVLFLSANHVWEFYDNVPFNDFANSTPVSRGAVGIDAFLEFNTISGTISVGGAFNSNNFGVSVFAADNPDPLNSSSLASGPVNPDGTYSVDLSAVDIAIDEFIVLFISSNYIWEFYDDVSLIDHVNATTVIRGADNIDAFLVSNYISGTITVDGSFNSNNFGVSVYAAADPDPLNSSPLASGPVNPDGTYFVDLSAVDKAITEFTVLFISTNHIWEFYDNVPLNQPQNAVTVPGGSSGINAHLQLNSIQGSITVEGDFDNNNFGVGVYAATDPDPLNSAPLASGPVNPDGTYSVDLSAVDKAITEFIVLFISTKHIWEFYNDVNYWEDINLVTPVSRGATSINAHLNTNTIKGTITLDEGQIIPSELGVTVYPKGTVDPLNASSPSYTTVVVEADGSYIIDLSETDQAVSEFIVLFIGKKYILEFYNDIPWQTPELNTPVQRGAVGIDAQLIYDKIPPELTVNDISANNDLGQAGATVFLTATASDNSGMLPLITYIPQSRSFFPLGITTVVATATDGAGNQDIKSFTVTVLDVEPPEITAPDIVVDNDLEQAGAIVTISVSATDNSGEDPVIACDHLSGSFFPLGVTSVECTATDASGNVANHTFTVTVLDVEPPVITSPDIVVNNDPGQSGAIVSLNVSAADNSGFDPDLTCSYPSGSFFPLGVTSVECTATDQAGNITASAFSVTVLDVEPPEITAPDIVVDNDLGQAGAIVTISVSATDNSGEDPVIACDHLSGSFFPLGVTSVECTATDASGNVANHTFTVTVLDVEPPVITSPDIVVNNDPGQSGAIVSLNVGAADNSGFDPDLTCSYPSGSFFPLGVTSVECTATDQAGNITASSFSVTVLNVEPPTISVPDDILIGNDPGLCAAVVTYSAPVGTSNCGGATTVQTSGLPSGSTFPIGSTTNTFEVSDDCGNTQTGSFEVIVSNETPIIELITAPVDPVQVGVVVNATANYTDSNITEAFWDWGDGSASYGIISSQMISGDHQYVIPGVYVLSLTITDECGESDTDIYQYVVIYDPDGGFVTGGGWIYSPPGAYTLDPGLEGKANFGFVSKYKKGTTVPTGNTEFQFKAGDLKFNSYLYDWLVIAGPQAKFKGEGHINGMGSYGFMLSAVDGQVNGGGGLDKFRIKIWDKFTEEVVYDNNLGAGDEENATTVIGGGSIVIHSDKKSNARVASSPTLEVEDISEIERMNFSVYPNPVTDVLTVELPDEFINKNADLDIHLFDLHGVDVLENRNRTFDRNNIIMDIQSIPTGIYLMVIQGENERFTYKLKKI